MPTADHLAGLLCHHGDDEDGHELAADCPLQVRPSGPALVTWPACSNGDRLHGFTYRTSPARGTCPVCGRAGVKVTAHTVRALGPVEVVPILASGKGLPLGIRPQLAEHKRPGRGAGQCPAVAAVPAELTYRSAAVEAWARDYGTEHVA